MSFHRSFVAPHPALALSVALSMFLAGTRAQADSPGTSPVAGAAPIVAQVAVTATEIAPGEAAAPAAGAVASPAPVVEPAPAVVAVPAVVAAPAVVAEPEAVPRPAWKLCVGFGVGGVAALVSGAILGGLAKARESEQHGDAANPSLYTSELAARGQEGDRMATAAYVLLALGAASAVVDVALWVERLRQATPKKKEGAQAGRPGLAPPRTAAVTVAPRLNGLEVSF